ncbi:MAG: hypothetical protein INF72_04320 [Roseomonas sp.]|nr:hypothetical protein [Roseomonas sp.]MCA3345258.1 hypothetical protein [Roseomonas sp.]MCA3374405.1 hypothetical protein [Roseomonas sp.]MCA3385954.1 hypothetical protein [Roseomonas sp.]MCA3395231.1 hypothetical protein [Roseomonas sp.]
MDATDTINQKPKIRLKLTPLAQNAGLVLTSSTSSKLRLGTMLSLNAIASVSQEIVANAGIIQARSPVQPVDALRGNPPGQSSQRSLEAVPPEPNKPMPRGSLLDLRV